MFQMDISFFSAWIKSLSPEARNPSRNPGTPYDLEMLLMTTKCGFSSNNVLLNKVALSSGYAKSRKDSSTTKRIPFSLLHLISANSSAIDSKFPDGLSGFIMISRSIALSSKKAMISELV